uniref:Uncharacterized protein n=1 Tax=Arundo donax TaxID=35708 RepID=A0A0A8ZPH3_ARUDO
MQQRKHHDCGLPIRNHAHTLRAMVVHPQLLLCITSLMVTTSQEKYTMH